MRSDNVKIPTAAKIRFDVNGAMTISVAAVAGRESTFRTGEVRVSRALGPVNSDLIWVAKYRIERSGGVYAKT